jgi:hypothetical protein
MRLKCPGSRRRVWERPGSDEDDEGEGFELPKPLTVLGPVAPPFLEAGFLAGRAVEEEGKEGGKEEWDARKAGQSGTRDRPRQTGKTKRYKDDRDGFISPCFE